MSICVFLYDAHVVPDDKEFCFKDVWITNLIPNVWSLLLPTKLFDGRSRM